MLKLLVVCAAIIVDLVSANTKHYGRYFTLTYFLVRLHISIICVYIDISDCLRVTIVNENNWFSGFYVRNEELIDSRRCNDTGLPIYQKRWDLTCLWNEEWETIYLWNSGFDSGYSWTFTMSECQRPSWGGYYASRKAGRLLPAHLAVVWIEKYSRDHNWESGAEIKVTPCGE